MAGIIGHEGEQTGPVYKITIGRPDIALKEHGATINSRIASAYRRGRCLGVCFVQFVLGSHAIEARALALLLTGPQNADQSGHIAHVGVGHRTPLLGRTQLPHRDTHVTSQISQASVPFGSGRIGYRHADSPQRSAHAERRQCLLDLQELGEAARTAAVRS